MISSPRFLVAALVGNLVCSVAGAQVRNAPMASVVLRSSPHATPSSRVSAGSKETVAKGNPTSQQPSLIRLSPSGQVNSDFSSVVNSSSLDALSGVPGLGFDFPHLAAISGGLHGNSFLRPGHHGHHGEGFFIPIFYGGYPYYTDDTGYDQPEQQSLQQNQPQPQIIVIQQPVPTQQHVDSVNNVESESAPEDAAQAALPAREVGDFIFVRRDGRILFASIFSVVATQLLYVTPEGIRHTIAVSDLDAEATQQMNEARGTTVQIHN